MKLPAQSPNLNAHAERWVRSVKEEALSKLILFGEASLRRTLSEYLVHFHRERNHQGKGNVLLFLRKPHSSIVTFLAICFIQASLGCGVIPATSTRRLSRWIKNST